MAATTENTLYYQIVLDATAAIEALREFGATGKEFEAVVKEEEAFINQLVETYGADASVIASVMRKMNSDISASNRERIKDTMEGEEQIKAALLQEREAYVALDAAIAQATRNIAGREAAVPATSVDYTAITRQANEFMAAIKTSGLTFDETMSAMR